MLYQHSQELSLHLDINASHSQMPTHHDQIFIFSEHLHVRTQQPSIGMKHKPLLQHRMPPSLVRMSVLAEEADE